MRISKSIPLVLGTALVTGTALTAPALAETKRPHTTQQVSQSCGGAKIIAPSAPGSMTASDIEQPSSAKIDGLVKNKSIRWITNSTCTQKKVVRQTKTAAKKSKATRSNASSSSNWSGYVGSNPNETNPNYVQTIYTEPSVKYTGGGDYGSIVTMWAGIGGFTPGSTLVQSGTDAAAFSDGTQRHFMWWEVYPDNAEQIVNSLPVKQGDKVLASSSWKNGTASFVLCNITKNVCGAFEKNNVKRPSNTVEWIAEKPTFSDGGMQPLANFGSLRFDYNYWDKSVVGRPLRTLDSTMNPVTLVSADGSRVNAVPGPVSNGGFTETYKSAN